MFTSSKPLHDYQLFIGNCERLTVILSFFLISGAKQKEHGLVLRCKSLKMLVWVQLMKTSLVGCLIWKDHLDFQLQFFSQE